MLQKLYFADILKSCFTKPLREFLVRSQNTPKFIIILFPTLDRNLESPLSDDAVLGALLSDVTVVVTGVDIDGVTMVAPGMALISTFINTE